MSDLVGRDVRKRFFLSDVGSEVTHAESLHPPINSLHEGYSVIKEELEEFWDEVKKRSKDRRDEDVYLELVQIAAMAARTAKDVMGVEL